MKIGKIIGKSIVIIISAVILTLLGLVSKSKIGFEDTVLYGLALIISYIVILRDYEK